MQPSFESFRSRLTEAIGDEGLYAWAARVGLNKGSLNTVMTRKAIPKVEMLAQIAEALGCTIDWLLGTETPAKVTEHKQQVAEQESPNEILTAVLAVERGIANFGALPADIRANLISLTFDAVQAGKAGDALTQFVSSLGALVASYSLTPDELLLLDIYRAAPTGRRRIMLTPNRARSENLIATGTH